MSAPLPLLHTPADILRWLLVGLGGGSDPTDWATGVGSDWPVFCSSEPSTPDNCVTTYDTAPREDGRAMKGGETFRHYGVQVRVRGLTHTSGYTRAESLRRIMDSTIYDNTVSLDSARYTVHSVSGTTVLSIGRDTPATKRSLFTLNAIVSLERVV